LLAVLDKDENGIFELERALGELGDDRPATRSFIQDIRHTASLRQVFEDVRPDVILHAAAFKHVPLLEEHVAEAVQNNVLATMQLIQLAHEFGVGSFVMISTDKAVNATSVMGATKRVAEMIVQAAAKRDGARYCCVRFGNVLESRGSVVPIFKRQIERGGPVTVTHPEMTRYFMTIGEASQLVLQAGSVGRRGEIFVLDMGEPVKVVNLAKDLIRLSGAERSHTIEIEFTGPRPGEKLSEELLAEDETARATSFKKVLVAASTPPSWDRVEEIVRRLGREVEAGDDDALVRTMQSLGIGYRGRGLAPSETSERSVVSSLGSGRRTEHSVT